MTVRFLPRQHFSVIYSVESGFIDGLSDSVWPDCPRWFPWCVRGA